MKSLEYYEEQKDKVQNLYNTVSDYLRKLEESESLLKADQKELNKNTFDTLSNIVEGVYVCKSSNTYTKEVNVNFPWKDRAERYTSLHYLTLRYDDIQSTRVEKDGRERKVFSERYFRNEIEEYKNYISNILVRLNNLIEDYDIINENLDKIRNLKKEFNKSVSEKYISDLLLRDF